MDRRPEYPPEPSGQLVDYPEYTTPTEIMKRSSVDPVPGPSPVAAISLESAGIPKEIDHPGQSRSGGLSEGDSETKEDRSDTRSMDAISAKMKAKVHTFGVSENDDHSVIDKTDPTPDISERAKSTKREVQNRTKTIPNAKLQCIIMKVGICLRKMWSSTWRSCRKSRRPPMN